MKRFEGQVAVVTGGSSGIGAEIVSKLIAEGANVAIWDIHPPSDAVVESGVHFQSVELTDPSAINTKRDELLHLYGKIDILISSAGITGPNECVEDYPNEDWKRVFDVNVNGVFYCNKAVIPAMRANAGGRIVNIASIAGKEGNPNASAYSASKAAVIGLTKSLGKELADTGVLVNAVTPAAVKTPMFDQMSESHIQFMLSKIPMGRFGEVSEIASLVLWLASQECSFSTGAVFDISGGRAVY